MAGGSARTIRRPQETSIVVEDGAAFGEYQCRKLRVMFATASFDGAEILEMQRLLKW
jgi:hypothetical protein